MSFADGFGVGYNAVDRYFERQNRDEQAALERAQRQKEFDANLDLNNRQLEQTRSYQAGALDLQRRGQDLNKADAEANRAVDRERMRSNERVAGMQIAEARKERERAERRTVLFGGYMAAAQRGDESAKARLLPALVREVPSMRDLLDPRTAEAHAAFMQAGKEGRLPSPQDAVKLGDSLFAPQFVGKTDENGRKIVGLSTKSVTPTNSRAPFAASPQPSAAPKGSGSLFGMPAAMGGQSGAVGPQPAFGLPSAAPGPAPKGEPSLTAEVEFRYDDGTKETKTMTRPMTYWMDSVAAQGVLYHALASDPAVSGYLESVMLPNGDVKPMTMAEANESYDAQRKAASERYSDMLADASDPTKDQAAAKRQFVIATTGQVPPAEADIDSLFEQAQRDMPMEKYVDSVTNWEQEVSRAKTRPVRPQQARMGDISARPDNQSAARQAQAAAALETFKRLNGGEENAAAFVNFADKTGLDITNSKGVEDAYNAWQQQVRQGPLNPYQ